MKKIIFKSFILGFVICSLLFTACTTNIDVSSNSNTHVVIDHSGNAVEVPNEINRVVVTDIYPIVSVLSIFFFAYLNFFKFSISLPTVKDDIISFFLSKKNFLIIKSSLL